MAEGRPKFAIDTNLYIDASKSEPENAALQGFLAAFTPFIHLAGVVVQELRAAVHQSDAEAFERDVTGPFVRRQRIFAPRYSAWEKSGQVLSTLVATEGLQLSTVTKSFANDVLLALSCRDEGITLVTRNARDFERIKRVVSDFRYVPPWPTA